MKDITKCLEIDPVFVRAYVRKGNCHILMKEFHKALKSFEDGLKIDPNNQECKDGKVRTM
jgi:stress-induced-phosphoprotein 1